MNIINRSLIKLTLLPAPFYRKIGVNIPQLKSILRIKLVMDDRRPNTIQQTRMRKSEKQISMATIGTMAISTVMGIMFLFCFFIGQNMVTGLTFYFTMFFFML